MAISSLSNPIKISSELCLSEIKRFFKNNSIVFPKENQDFNVKDWKRTSKKSVEVDWVKVDCRVFSNKETNKEISIYANKEKVTRIDYEGSIYPINDDKYVVIDWKRYLRSLAKNKIKEIEDKNDQEDFEENLIKSLIESSKKNWNKVLKEIDMDDRDEFDKIRERESENDENLTFHPKQKFNVDLCWDYYGWLCKIWFWLGDMDSIHTTNMEAVIWYINAKIKKELNIDFKITDLMSENTFSVEWNDINENNIEKVKELLYSFGYLPNDN